MVSPRVRGSFGGVTVVSDLALATLPAAAEGAEGALEIIRAGAPLRPPTEWRYLRPSAVSAEPFATVGTTADGYFIRVIGVGDFVVDRACTTVAVWSERTDEALEGILLNHIIAPSLQLRERLVLHGSAVSFGGTAAAFLGPSGVGKSTLAAAVTSAAVIADDAVVILDDLRVAPTAAGFRLRHGAAEHFGIPSSARRHGRYPLRREVGRTSSSLRALFWVEPTHDDEPSLRELSMSDGLSTLLACVERIDLHDAALLGVEIDRLTRVLTHVPVFALRVPRRLPELPRVAEFVELVVRDLRPHRR